MMESIDSTFFVLVACTNRIMRLAVSANLTNLAETPRFERGQPSSGFGRLATCWFNHSPTSPNLVPVPGLEPGASLSGQLLLGQPRHPFRHTGTNFGGDGEISTLMPEGAGF